MHKLPAILSVALMLTACSGASPETKTDEQNTSSESPSAVEPAAIALQIAGDHSGSSDTELLSIEARDFPNPGLGCPDPDMAYPAVITPGYLALVKVGEETLDIRIAGQAGFVCTQQAVIPPKGNRP